MGKVVTKAEYQTHIVTAHRVEAIVKEESHVAFGIAAPLKLAVV
jgi:hypothetical protein